VSLLESALELRRQVFSAGSYLYADTASALAAALLKQHKASADASSSSSSGGVGGGWLRGKGKAAAEPAGVLRAIELYKAAVDIVVDAGEWWAETEVLRAWCRFGGIGLGVAHVLLLGGGPRLGLWLWAVGRAADAG
jgi:hypothetical protein